MARHPELDTDSPASASLTISTSDSNLLAIVCRGLYVGVTGDVKVRMAGDQSTPTFTAVPAGVILPIEIDKVFATGTTATNMVGLR